MLFKKQKEEKELKSDGTVVPKPDVAASTSVKGGAGKMNFGKLGDLFDSIMPKPSKFLKGPRFVLFIGDEGTILLYMKKNVVLSRQFVPDTSEQHLEELRASFAADPQAPLSMVIDNLDQTYVQQTLPPVSSMSVKKLMKRRLERDFGANDIKNARLLGRDTTGRKDWNFLMVSIEKNPQITAWLDFIYSLPNRFIGIYLVSLESEVLIKNIEQAMGLPKAGTGSKWKFFISHNKVGGFRQVILRDGRISFTRMALPIGDSTPEVIAGNIEQEMQSTIEYMKRLSFDPDSGLDVYIVAGNAVKPLIDLSKFKVKNFNILTPYETAQYLGIEGATQPTDQFGDVILAATISASARHVMKFSTPESKVFDTFYQLFLLQRAVVAAILAGFLFYAGSTILDIYDGYNTAGDLEDSQHQRQSKLSNLQAEIKRNNLDLDKTGDIIELYQLLAQQNVSPLDFIAKVETVIAPPIIVKSVEWVAEEKVNPNASASANATKPKPKITAVFTLEFPEVKNVEAWREVSKNLLSSLKTSLKGFDASFTKLPGRFSESEKIDITFDGPAAKNAAGNDSSEVQLTIKEL